MKFFSLAIGLFFCVLAAPALAQCNGTINTIPIHEADPVFVRSVSNGKLFLGGTANDTFYILHVYGTPYEMGYAHGQIFKDEIPDGLNKFYAWVADYIETLLPWLPAEVAELIVKEGAPAALGWTYKVTHPFTPAKYDEEMQGIADGAGVAVEDIRNINMVAELIKAQCSIIGAAGRATSSSLGGTLVHLRTLDGMGGATAPMKDYALVTVYHPSAPSSPAVANFAWVSFVGSVTGFSETIGLGEKYWNSQPHKLLSVHGEAWTFLTRDALSSANLDAALLLLQNANRTCAVNLGLGDHATNRFVGVQMAAHAFGIVTDTTFNYTHHPALPDVVYMDKYDQPTSNSCLATLLQQYYGQITAALLATHVAPVSQTGDLHAAVFDYHNKLAYFANARKSSVATGGLNSYDRQFTRLDMAALFAEKL
eukprot:m.238896 g.238896  ORF g.238896 m.238896 type:complete len:424 (+) comp22108_c0_seq1:142-1413(+)